MNFNQERLLVLKAGLDAIDRYADPYRCVYGVSVKDAIQTFLPQLLRDKDHLARKKHSTGLDERESEYLSLVKNALERHNYYDFDLKNTPPAEGGVKKEGGE